MKIGLGFGPYAKVAAAVFPPAFSPADLSGLALWLDAADNATITQVAGAVSLWSDKSGNNRHVSNATGAQQPVYTGTFAPAANVSFNGTSQNLFNTLPFMYSAGACTIFMVADIPAQSLSRYFLTETSTASGNQGTSSYLPFRQGSGGGDLTYNQSEMYNDAGSLRVSTRYGNTPIFLGAGTSPNLYTFMDNGSLLSLRKDAVDAASTTSYTRSGALTSNRFVVGAGIFSGGPSSFGKMNLRELVIYTRALNNSDRNTVEGYLKSRWGTP